MSSSAAARDEAEAARVESVLEIVARSLGKAWVRGRMASLWRVDVERGRKGGSGGGRRRVGGDFAVVMVRVREMFRGEGGKWGRGR